MVKSAGDAPAVRIPANFVVEELTDAENMVRFGVFERWLSGEERFLVEFRIERSLAVLDILPDGFEVERSVVGSLVVALMARGQDATLGFDIGTSHTEISVTATTQERAEEVVAQVKKKAEAVADKTKVPIRVWTNKHQGEYSDRMLEALQWETAVPNYPPAVAAQLAALMKMTPDKRSSGRLVLWHGEPGTGKTTALRALAQEWREWCTVQYISDPEHLFKESEYLSTVLEEPARDPIGPTLTAPSKPDQTWRLIVAEDSDEYLRSNARESAGAALGRVLNLSDGILGQHHNVMLLLTTNEDVNRLHPALVRPGRCLSNIEFTKFSTVEAKRWLDGKGKTPSRPQTLAQLLVRRGDIVSNVRDELPTNIGAYL